MRQHLCALRVGSWPGLPWCEIEEQGLRLRQVVLGRSCWKKGLASDVERGSKDRAPLHPIYEVRQLAAADRVLMIYATVVVVGRIVVVVAGTDVVVEVDVVVGGMVDVVVVAIVDVVVGRTVVVVVG